MPPLWHKSPRRYSKFFKGCLPLHWLQPIQVVEDMTAVEMVLKDGLNVPDDGMDELDLLAAAL